MQSSIIGNQHIFDFLSKSIANKKLAHAYIFAGPDNLGKATSAILFAKILMLLALMICWMANFKKIRP